MLFELIAERYERRSMLITANQPFSAWDGIFPELISAVTVTDPQHPLVGQRLTVLSLLCARGPRFIAVALPDGRRRLIRRAATDLERPAGATELPVPRVSIRTLLPLARLVRSVLAASSAEPADAVPSPPNPASTPAPSTAPKAMADALAQSQRQLAQGVARLLRTRMGGGAPC